MIGAARALALARAAGVHLQVDGAELVVTAQLRPAADVLELLARHKPDIIALLISDGRTHVAIDPGDAANINAWLDSIGEHDPAERAAVFARCAESPDTCALVVGVAVGALLGWDTPTDEAPDARRTCRTCEELAPSGLCRAAMRGGIDGAAASWEPRADVPRRCAAYVDMTRSRAAHRQSSERDST